LIVPAAEVFQGFYNIGELIIFYFSSKNIDGLEINDELSEIVVFMQ
jgi:hypothetical protein